MRSIPKCLRGACVGVVRVSMHEILDGKESGNGWKLLFLLPRLLFFVVQAFEVRFGVEAEVARAHAVSQRQEHKWQRTISLGEPRRRSDSHFWVSCQQEDRHLRGPPSPLAI